MAEKRIEFVSYDGKWPNLCRGELTLKVDGVFERFHYSYYKSNDPHKHPNFWSSGGGCGFNGEYSESYVNEGPWEIDPDFLPDYLQPYADEIAEMFNENVPHGCCGGCL